MSSERAIVLSVPGTLGPAVAGPLTGGQIWAQLPVHRDVVAVSGANQYRVKPCALVSTAAPPIVVVFSALPAAAAPDAAPGGALASQQAGTTERQGPEERPRHGRHGADRSAVPPLGVAGRWST